MKTKSEKMNTQKKYKKYNTVNNCPIKIKGSSTAWEPIQVNNKKQFKNIIKINL